MDRRRARHWTGGRLTTEEIADLLQERFEQTGADGFNLTPPCLHRGVDDFIPRVVPELRRRGLFRDHAHARRDAVLG